MRRGFKTEAAQIGEQIRAELDLTQIQPLDPWRLADHLEVPIIPLSDFRADLDGCVETLTGPEREAFSAMVAACGTAKKIVHNDSHALTRQRANLCHELAHVLLIHQPHPARPGEALVFDRDQEEEAAWLGAVLLVPDAACMRVCRAGLGDQDAASRLGVSVALMRWRINKSGARTRVERARRRG